MPSPQQPNIDELIGRLEKATGPSAELDADIWLATRVGWASKQYSNWAHHLPRDENKSERAYALERSKPFTASIDAALTLVPEGWTTKHHQAAPDRWHVYVCRHSADREGISPPHEFLGIGIPAIAFCIAALKARTSTTGTPK